MMVMMIMTMTTMIDFSSLLFSRLGSYQNLLHDAFMAQFPRLLHQ